MLFVLISVFDLLIVGQFMCFPYFIFFPWGGGGGGGDDDCCHSFRLMPVRGVIFDENFSPPILIQSRCK